LASRDTSEAQENLSSDNGDEGGDCHADNDFSATRDGSKADESSHHTSPIGDSVKTLAHLESLMDAEEREEEVLREAGAALMTLERQPLLLDLALEYNHEKVF